MPKQRSLLTWAFASVLALACILADSNQPLKAQVGTASLDGTVSDPTGAGIPAAQVSLESMTRKASRQTVTDKAGSYVFTSLLPDTYQLVVTAKGFTTKTTQNILLASGQGSTLNVTMELGAAVTHVTVTEHAPLLETTTATLGSRVESQQLVTLPLLGRNFSDMMLIVPGASVPGGTYFNANFSPAGSGQTFGGDVALYGQRPRNNEFTVDGVPNDELLFDGLPLYPPPEAIAEMKIESGMDSGAYGYASGANINVVTKSGTNAYHADLWEFLRNDDLNARNFFSPTVGRLRWNQFGFSGGGPLVIPKVLSKERGWYIFGWYEGIRLPSVSPFYGLVPTNAELAGDFSLDPPIYNPYTSVVAANGTLISRTPFANNQIPTGSTNVCSPNPTCFNSGALLIISTLLPRANLPAGSGPGGTDYLGTSVSDSTYDQWSTRVDHQFGQKDTFYGRYSDARFHRLNASYPNDPNIATQRFTNLAASETHTFGPTFLLTARFGLARSNWVSNNAGPDVADPGGTMTAFPQSFNGLNRIPSFNISGGIPSVGQGASYYGPENFASWTLDIQKIVGGHTLSFGGWYMRDLYRTGNLPGTGSESFDNVPTSGLTSGTGYGLASFLLALPSSASRIIGSSQGDMITNFYSIYVQDSFRATRKLTVNLGLRYDYSPPSVNQHGSATFVWETGQYIYDRTNPITGAAPNAPLGLIEADKKNFQPRIGLAYQINPKTTVRASYGIFDDIYGENAQGFQGNRGNWPYSFPQSVGPTNTGLPQYYLQNPFPGPAQGSTTPLACSQCLEVATSASRTPYVQQWSLSVQRQLTPTLMWETAYFGSHGIHQTGQIVDNGALYPGTSSLQLRQRWPQFPPYTNNRFNEFPSTYNGLTVDLRKTYSHGLSSMVAYTWSKAMSVSDGLATYWSGAAAYVIPTRFDYQMRYGPAGFNSPQRLTGSYTWDIPGKTGSKFADGVVANWSFSGVVTFDSGHMYFVVMCADNANVGTAGQCITLPNLVGNPVLPNPTINEWFNTSAYQIPPFGTMGNAGKHALYSQPMKDLDCSLYKRWPFKETRDLEFRAEFFNAFNHPIFSPPGSLIDSPSSFGKVSNTRLGGRQIQFALKIHF